MKKWMVALVVVVACMAGVALYFFYKKPRDVRESVADFEITAKALMESYEDEQKANQLYLGKVITVEGVVASVEDQDGDLTIFLETGDPLTGITCSFYPEERDAAKVVQRGDKVRIKGECTGKLTDIVLNHCSLIK